MAASTPVITDRSTLLHIVRSGVGVILTSPSLLVEGVRSGSRRRNAATPSPLAGGETGPETRRLAPAWRARRYAAGRLGIPGGISGRPGESQRPTTDSAACQNACPLRWRIVPFAHQSNPRGGATTGELYGRLRSCGGRPAVVAFRLLPSCASDCDGPLSTLAAVFNDHRPSGGPLLISPYTNLKFIAISDRNRLLVLLSGRLAGG